MEGAEELTLRGRWAFLNPLTWSKHTVNLLTVAFFALALPLYLIIGFQPAESQSSPDLPTLGISSINLETPVAALELQDHQLIAPATIAGSFSHSDNKTLLIGHSSTVFQNLHQVSKNDVLAYDKKLYLVTKIETLEKSAVKMSEILAPADRETVILMTCAGEPLENQDATHRLVITAEILNP